MSPDMDDTLLPEIERFLNLTGMSPTRFSEEAIKDRHFVRQLRKGRRVWPETAAKAREYMAKAGNKPSTEARAA